MFTEKIILQLNIYSYIFYIDLSAIQPLSKYFHYSLMLKETQCSFNTYKGHNYGRNVNIKNI